MEPSALGSLEGSWRQHLAPGTAAVEYQPLGNSVVATVITASDTFSVELPLARTTREVFRLSAMCLEPDLLMDVDTAGVEARAALRSLQLEGHAALIQPIRAQLDPATNGLAIVAHGELARIPFHLLCPAGMETSDIDISYLPDLRALGASRVVPPGPHPMTILADPQRNLPLARGLAMALAQPDITVRFGAAVTSSAVVEAIEADADLLILSHGTQEGLPLADGLLRSRLLKERIAASRCPSVALVACKAGHGFALPWSSSSALPSILLEAGVGAVTAARWDLPELSAGVFADRWCRERLHGHSPMRSYRSAGNFVRSMTVRDLLAWIDDRVSACGRLADEETAHWFGAACAWELAAIGEGSANGTKDPVPAALETAIQQLRRCLRALTTGTGTERIPLFRIKERVEELREKSSRLVPLADGSMDLPAFTAPVHWAGLCLFGMPA